ncbi:hypothetical protein KAH37_02060 [bacterium]|nr:hypothetical protein [bacterium]
MKLFRSMLLVFILMMMPLVMVGETHGTMPGGEPTMSFEDGGLDFFVLFNSLLDDTITLYGETAANPQGDTCLNSSPFTLTDKHVPNDAIVESAYLVWMGAVAPEKLGDPTDNEVTLSFDNENAAHAVTGTTAVKSGDAGKLLTDTTSPFDFEGIKFEDDVEVGCSETSDGSTVRAEVGYFTYRVDVTEFMKKVQKDGMEKDDGAIVNSDSGVLSGNALYGKYTVSDLECTDHDNYKCRTTMVSAWSLIVIYRSGKIRSKKIYFYNGLSYVQGERSKAEVSGFNLPQNPIVRQTLMVAEGDPALEVNPTMPKEGIMLTGEGATAPYHLHNKCNPKTGLDYEVYNSNSSIINWDPEAAEEDLISCVTGGTGDQKYGIDVDTFLLDAEKDINLQEHLARGNTKMDITLSVNQDAIITNFLMLSVDTKSPGWDVPPEAKNLPFTDDREKQWCACKTNNAKAEYYCYGERPFYYMIKVENWGTNIAKDVWVSDELINLVYIPGTTEVASKYSSSLKYYTDWKPIADKAGATAAEKFPLSGKGVKVADEMKTCDIASWTCTDTRLVRFLVTPKSGLSKNAVLENIAVISDGSGTHYKTNNSWPIPTSGVDCVGLESCSQPKPEDCGGIPDDTCHSDDDCEEGKKCNAAGECVFDGEVCSAGTIVKYTVGPNTPSDTSKHIIYRDNGGKYLVAGQFTLNATTCGNTKNFFFTALFASNYREDKLIEFPDQQIVYDKDNDGVYTQGIDTIVSKAAIKENTGFRILIKDDMQAYTGSTDHNFLILTKVDYPSTQKVGKKSTFNLSIVAADSFHGQDQAGDLEFKGLSIKFATFMLEPEGNYFLATLGSNDASVPQDPTKWKGETVTEIPVMQMWTKSSEVTNELTEIAIKMAPGSNMRFGDNIPSVSLYQDSDGDGTGDVLLQKQVVFTANTALFNGFDLPLNYGEGEDKTFVVQADMRGIEAGQKVIFYVADRSLKLKDSTTIVGTPIYSKLFQCTNGDATTARTCPIEDKGGGGKCTITSVNQTADMSVLALLALLLSTVLFFSRRRSSRK